jgi:hypothetical protein
MRNGFSVLAWERVNSSLIFFASIFADDGSAKSLTEYAPKPYRYRCALICNSLKPNHNKMV